MNSRPNGKLGVNGGIGESDPIIYKTTRSGLPYRKSDIEALRIL